MNLEPYQQRVVDEEAELRNRLHKLTEFCSSPSFVVKLPVEEQLRMRRQQSAMSSYLAILQDRIAAFNRAPQDLEALSAKLYTTYCAATGGVAFNGDPLPDWEAFAADENKTKQANAWRAVASEALGNH